MESANQAVVTRLNLDPWFVKVIPLLESRGQGEAVEAKEVEKITSINGWLFGSRIKTWYRKNKGFVAVQDKTVGGWRLLTNPEQNEHSEKRFNRGEKQVKLGLGEALTTRDDGLTDDQKKARDHRIQFGAKTLESYARHKKENKSIMGAPTPPPRLPGKK